MAEITVWPTLMLNLGGVSPVEACRIDPLPAWTGHAAREAPACFPLLWAAEACVFRLGWREQAGSAGAGWQVRGNCPCGKEAWRGGLRVSSRGGGRVTGYYTVWLLHPAVSIVLPAVKLLANAGVVRVPARAARPLLHPSLGQLAVRLQAQRVGRRPAAAPRR